LNRQPKIRHDIVAVFGLRAAALLLSFVLSIFLARWLGPREYGLLAFVLSLSTLFQLFSDPGIGQSSVKYIAEYRHRKPSVLRMTILRIVQIRLLISVCAGIVSLSLADPMSSAFGYPGLLPLLRLSALYIVLTAGLSTLQTLLQGFERLQASALVTFVVEVAKLPICTLLVLIGQGMVGAYSGYLISLLAGIAVALLLFRRTYGSLSGSESVARELLVYAVPLWLNAIFTTVISNVDDVVIGLFRPPQEVAFYAVASGLIQVLVLLPSVLNTVYFPRVASLFARREDATVYRTMEDLFSKTVNYLLILYVPAAAGLFYLADPLISILFEGQYGPSAFLLEILVVNLIPLSLMPVIAPYFAASNRARALTLYMGVATVFNVTLNLALIPTYGAAGAAVAAVSSQVLLLVIAYVKHVQFFGHQLRATVPVIRIAGSTGIMLVVLYTLVGIPTGIGPIAVSVGIGASVYFSLMYLFGAFRGIRHTP